MGKKKTTVDSKSLGSSSNGNDSSFKHTDSILGLFPKYMLGLAVILLIFAVIAMFVVQDEFVEESFLVKSTVTRTPYIQRDSMFPLMNSHNPDYDSSHELNLMKKHQNPWSVWSPVSFANNFEILEDTNLNILEDSSEIRRFVEVGRMRFTFLTSQLLRMEWDKDSIFQNEATIVFSDRQKYLEDDSNLPPLVRIIDEEKNGRILKLESTHLRVIYGSNEAGMYYIQSPAPLNSTLKVEILGDNGIVKETWIPGMGHDGNLGGTVRTLDRTHGPVPVEPGLLSRLGWTLVDDTHSPYLLQVENENEYESWPKERNAPDLYSDWYLFGYGNNYKECLGDFVKVAGNIPLPPKYAFGIWWSRWWKYSDNELKDLVGEFKDNHVPLDNLVIDMDWHLTAYDEMNMGALDRAGQPLGWTGYSWDYELFPSPSDFLEWCHEQGLKTTLNLHPAAGVQPHEYFYPNIANAMDINPNTSIHVPFDIANSKFTRNYFNHVIHPLEEDGIDFWWLDYQQVQITNITNLNPTIWLNHCFFNDMERDNRTYYNSDTPLRGLIFHRWGGLGNHRYQIGFSGDTSSTWEALNFQVFFTTTAANVGFGYWSHDIGGFMSNRPTNGEMFTRWVQWGVLSPIYRTHAWRQEYIERRIWKYSSYYFWCMREAIYIRYSLLPYLYTEARRSYDTGVAMLYPMYYDYPNDSRSFTFKTQGMLGNSIVIAPVTEPTNGVDLLASKLVFLPGVDDTWIEWHSLTALKSGTYTRKIATDEIPIYIKAGTIIPMRPMSKEVQNMMHMKQDPLQLSIFPGPNSESGSYKLYEDDGVTVNYKNNTQNAWTLIESIPDLDNLEWKVKIHPVSGSFEGMSKSRSYLVKLVGVPPPVSVSINGRQIPKQSKGLYSTAPQAFMHWVGSRDPSHNFMSPIEQAQGWFYDYDHLTLVFRTPSIQRNSMGDIVVGWNLSKEGWNESLELLHQGWMGLKTAISRGFFYWHGAEIEQQPTHKLPQTLSNQPTQQWQQIFDDFSKEYTDLIQAMESVLDEDPQMKEFRKRVLSNMRHYIK